MGEAKRRKQLDPNYGKAGHSYRVRKAQAAFTYDVVEIPSPMPTAASAYDELVRTIVTEHREGLLAQAVAARKADWQEMLCLLASRSAPTAESMIIRMCPVMQAKAAWLLALRDINKSAAMEVDELFSTGLSELKPTQFLWAHLDIRRKGLWMRLVPVEDSEIAQVCRP